MFDRIKKWMPFKRGDEAARRVAPESNQDHHPLTRLEQDFNQLVGRIGSLWSANGTSWPDPHADGWFGDFSPATFSPTLDLADKRVELVAKPPRRTRHADLAPEPGLHPPGARFFDHHDQRGFHAK